MEAFSYNGLVETVNGPLHDKKILWYEGKWKTPDEVMSAHDHKVQARQDADPDNNVSVADVSFVCFVDWRKK